MSVPAPQIYINDQLMDSYALDDTPVLAGLTLDWGTGSDIEFAGPDQLQLDLMIKQPSDLSFLDLGNVVAVYQPDDNPPPGMVPSPATYFVGRLQRATAEPLKGGKLRISLTASGATADLENQVLYNVNVSAQTAQNRSYHHSSWNPPGWSILSFGPRFPALTHAAMRWIEKPYLELLDMFLRAQLMQRAEYSTYDPAVGLTQRLITYHDTTRLPKADKLIMEADRSWDVQAGGPGINQFGVMRVEARDVHLEAGWTKEPDDVITEVSLAAVKPLKADGSETTLSAASSFDHVPRAVEARARYGIRSVEFDTDLPMDAATQGPAVRDAAPIWDHWITTESQWRPQTVKFVDRALTADQVRQLLNTISRQRTFLVIRHLLDNRPDHEYSDLRGVVIAGTAVWTGTKWQISASLSRMSLIPKTEEYWSFDKLEGTIFSQSTCADVGDHLSFSDFKRIGTP